MSAQLPAELEELYRAAVGPSRADYYVEKFLRFDEPGASRISWNWAAFFPPISLFWFLYRRMYGYWAVLYLLIPAVTISGELVALASRSSILIHTFNTAALAFSYVAVPAMANALYHGHTKRRIEALHRRISDPNQQVLVLENTPHTSPVACVVLAVLTIPVTGILAAIAIPAYQVYTARAEIAQSLAQAGPLERAVEKYFGRQHQWPDDPAAIGVSQPPVTRYVAAIGLSHGTLSITYGSHANPLLSGQVLSLRPTILAGRVRWICEFADIEGHEPTTDVTRSSRMGIDARDLPPSCRGDAQGSEVIAGGQHATLDTVVRPRQLRPATALPPDSATTEPTATDNADSAAVARAMRRLRVTEEAKQTVAGGAPVALPTGACSATVAVDSEGQPGSGFPIKCGNERMQGLMRQAVIAAAPFRAAPGSVVRLEVRAPDPEPGIRRRQARLDLPDSIAVDNQVAQMRIDQVRSRIRSRAARAQPVFGHCSATVQVGNDGMPHEDFPVTCSDPRLENSMRRAVLAIGSMRAQPGSTALLRVDSIFPAP